MPVDGVFTLERELSRDDGWWIRFFWNETIGYGLVTCSDEYPKLYQDISKEELIDMYKETKELLE
jgi:hypothetical protein